MGVDMFLEFDDSAQYQGRSHRQKVQGHAADRQLRFRRGADEHGTGHGVDGGQGQVQRVQLQDEELAGFGVVFQEHVPGDAHSGGAVAPA